jgi:hypothetical protein
MGGFAVSQYFGLERETADLDVLSLIPTVLATRVETLAGFGSALHKKHGCISNGSGWRTILRAMRIA